MDERQIFDSEGVVKKEKLSVETRGGLFILPTKDSNNEESDE